MTHRQFAVLRARAPKAGIIYNFNVIKGHFKGYKRQLQSSHNQYLVKQRSPQIKQFLCSLAILTLTNIEKYSFWTHVRWQCFWSVLCN